MILKPLEFLYHILSDAKNVLYDFKLIGIENLEVPVISIGNLSFGGTGKTPFIEFIANEFKNRRLVLICRSYKIKSSRPQKVDLSLPNAAQIFGDEAVLLQQRLPFVSVWSGPSKAETARASLVEKPELILVDDGFSHRKLNRQFDIVLFDSSRIGNEYFREGLRSLKRAQSVVLMKTQFASADKVRQFKSMLGQKFPHLANSIFEATSQTSLSFSPQFPLFVICGIAKPESFRQSLLEKSYQIEHFKAFADHQVYTEDLQKKILQDYNQLLRLKPDLKLVVTEKDFVKLSYEPLRQIVEVAQYQVQLPTNQKERLFEKISQSL